MDLEATTPSIAMNDGLDRDAAMTRVKIINPLDANIVPNDIPDSEIVAHNEIATATVNVDADKEFTARDTVDTFSGKDSAAALKATAFGLGALMIAVLGYLAFLLSN